MKTTKTIAKIAGVVLAGMMVALPATAKPSLKGFLSSALETEEEKAAREKFEAYEAAVAAVESAVQKKDRAAFDTAYKTAIGVEKSEIPAAKTTEFEALAARLNEALPNTPANSEKDFTVELTDDENGVVITKIKEEAVRDGKPVVIPSEIQGMPVHSINLSHNTNRLRGGNISLFIVPEGVKNVYIDTTTSSEIKELRLSEGVEFLTIDARGCRLKKINFPSTLKIVHGNLPCECLETSEFIIPEGVLIWACNLVHGGATVPFTMTGDNSHAGEKYVPSIKKLVLPKSVYFEGGSSGIFPDLRCGGKLEDVVIPNGAEYSCNTNADARTLEDLCGKLDSLVVQKKLRNTVFKRRDMNAAEKAAVNEYANWLGKRFILWFSL